MQLNYIPSADDMLELELNSVLRDLEGFLLQAKSNPNKFTKFYHIISEMDDVMNKLSSVVAFSEGEPNPEFGRA